MNSKKSGFLLFTKLSEFDLTENIILEGIFKGYTMATNELKRKLAAIFNCQTQK